MSFFGPWGIWTQLFSHETIYKRDEVKSPKLNNIACGDVNRKFVGRHVLENINTFWNERFYKIKMGNQFHYHGTIHSDIYSSVHLRLYDASSFPCWNAFYPSSLRQRLCKELNIGSNAFRRQFGFSREAQVVRRETLLWLWLEMKFRGDSEETNKRSWNWTNKQLRKFWCVLPMSSLFTSFVNRERPPRASIAFLWLLRPIFGDRFTKIQWPERSGWQSWKLSIATVGESASSRVQFQLRVCQLPECELVNHWAIERFLKHSRECQLLLWDVTDDF